MSTQFVLDVIHCMLKGSYQYKETKQKLTNTNHNTDEIIISQKKWGEKWWRQIIKLHYYTMNIDYTQLAIGRKT